MVCHSCTVGAGIVVYELYGYNLKYYITYIIIICMGRNKNSPNIHTAHYTMNKLSANRSQKKRRGSFDLDGHILNAYV